MTDFLPGSTHEIRSILIIQNAELEDSGTYACNVSEGYHEKTDRKDLTVHVIGELLPMCPKQQTTRAPGAMSQIDTLFSLHSLQLSPLITSALSNHGRKPALAPCHPSPLLGFKPSQISHHDICDPFRHLGVWVRVLLRCAVPRQCEVNSAPPIYICPSFM